MDTESRGGEPSDAVKLFAEAASQAIPDFRVSSRNRKLVDRIVAATEGVPIHIVLATGKLRYMSLQELADRLDQNRLDTLKRKPVGADRHFSSIAVVEDSVKLLGKEELELLFGLSVFKGGFFLVDAASVLSSFEDVEGGVDELRNNSLLNGIAVHGRTRFRSLDLVSEYVERQVDPQWIAPMARMHADYFSSRSKQVRAEFEVGAWHQVQAVFWSDLANYRQAIQYALKNRDQALICEFGRYLARIFMESGLLSDFRDLAEAAERSAREQDDHVLLIEILGLTGGVKRREQNLPAAIQIWTERIELCLQEGELEQAAEGWLDLIDVAHSNKDFVRFKEYLDAFQSLVPQLKNEVILAQGLSLRALYLAEMGSGGESVELLRRAQALLEHLPSEGPEFYMWQSIAGVYGLLGEPLRSIDVCRKWLPRTLAAKQRSSSGLFLLRLHDALLQSKRYESAAKALALALAIPKSISVRLRELANEKSVEFEERHGIATPPEPQNETAWNAAVRDLMQQITAFEKEPL
jgi:tetratricopeptide (TPR) repeat protein